MPIFAALLLSALPSPPSIAADQKQKPTFEQYLRQLANPQLKSGPALEFSKWRSESELGFIEKNHSVVGGGTCLVEGGAIAGGSACLGGGKIPGGIDGSTYIETLQPDGARTSFVYAGRKPRINSYGDSFTHGDQVNDTETWQEYLAGNLLEPIGNFGVGGYGVYQAYRRMIREEMTDHGAEYLILYICCDDSTRSLYRSWNTLVSGPTLMAVTKPNVEIDLDTGRFVEKENLLPGPESFRNFADSQWIVDHFKDELALQLTLYEQGAIRDLDRKRVDILARLLDFHFDWKQDDAGRRSQAGALIDRYSQRATIFILGKARLFAREREKKLLVVLNDIYRALPEMIEKGTRYDQEVVDYLKNQNFDYFDMNEVHLRDQRKTGLSYQAYIRPYQINGAGHYNPTGNHFFAYSIKDKIVGWLDPKPITYRDQTTSSVDYKQYMFNGNLRGK